MQSSYPYSTPFCLYQSTALKEQIYKYGEKRYYKANTVVSRPGEQSKSVLYLDEGRLRILATSPEGKEQILLILEEGSLIGAVSLLLDELPTNTIVTETPVVMYAIDYSIIIANDILKDNLLTFFACLIRTLLKSVEGLSLNSCKTRLYHLFLSSLDKTSSEENNWYNLKFQYTQDEMAKIISANRVTVCRLTAELCNEGLIRIVNRKIQVKISTYEKRERPHLNPINFDNKIRL